MRKRSSCKEAVLASHRDLKGYVAQARDVAQIGGGAHGGRSRRRGCGSKYLGQGFLALVFMIGTLAGMAGGFLALLAFRLAGGGGLIRLPLLCVRGFRLIENYPQS